MKYILALATCFALFFTLSAVVVAQESSLVGKDQIVWAHEFLRALYPDMDGKKYTLTVETYLNYDQSSSAINWLRMDIGEGPRDWYKGNSGGCLYEVKPPPVGWPKEMGPPPAYQISPTPKDENCKQGSIFPKQYMTAAFQFDEYGRLISFTSQGPAINDGQADNEVYEIVRAHPGITNDQIAAALKQTGTKYGPDDKVQFIRDLPLKKLEQFLGTLEVISVGFHPLNSDRAGLGSWPDWSLTARGRTKDGVKVTYEIFFDHLKGYLIGLRLVPDSR